MNLDFIKFTEDDIRTLRENLSVFEIQDTKEWISAVESRIFPTLRKLLKECRSAIREVYGVDPQPLMGECKSPQTQKAATRIENDGRCLLGYKPRYSNTSPKYTIIRRKNGERAKLIPSELIFSLRVDTKKRLSVTFAPNKFALQLDCNAYLESLETFCKSNEKLINTILERYDIETNGWDHTNEWRGQFYTPYFKIDSDLTVEHLMYLREMYVALYPLLEASRCCALGESTDHCVKMMEGFISLMGLNDDTDEYDDEEFDSDVDEYDDEELEYADFSEEDLEEIANCTSVFDIQDTEEWKAEAEERIFPILEKLVNNSRALMCEIYGFDPVEEMLTERFSDEYNDGNFKTSIFGWNPAMSESNESYLTLQEDCENWYVPAELYFQIHRDNGIDNIDLILELFYNDNYEPDGLELYADTFAGFCEKNWEIVQNILDISDATDIEGNKIENIREYIYTKNDDGTYFGIFYARTLSFEDSITEEDMRQLSEAFVALYPLLEASRCCAMDEPTDHCVEMMENFMDFYDSQSDDEVITEGRVATIQIHKYERSRRARKRCLELFGTKCSVCGFDFEEKYGEIGKNFIHVHHLTDISSIGGEYQLNPQTDLRPVCPNCHAMLHTTVPAMSIEELKKLVRKDI